MIASAKGGRGVCALNIYVGNLSRSTTEEDTRKLFEPYGEADSVDLITDRYSGESRPRDLPERR
jgi:RNA recognition motif-containing protein